MRRLLFVAAAATLLTSSPALAQKFVGAEKCSKCHTSAESGGQFPKWKASKHAAAWDVVATADPAKAGIDLTDKAEVAARCMKCHSTASGARDKTRPEFKPQLGVQCESCHGPGEKHVKARLAAQSTDDEFKVAAGEIVGRPDGAACAGCHNKDCPFFNGFKLESALRRISHPRPKASR